ERTSLVEANMPGKRLRLTGFVLDQNCQPVAGAFLDFWQADSQGVYDNTGFTLRGHQFTAADGSFILETVVPGEYPGRTEHIHVKVQAPGGEMLTSQLFFPGKNANESDRIFNEQLLVSILQDSYSMIAEFTFIVP
ncbi:MAG: hypothetical protein HY835_14760, partial [Anaerolineae bacterium]|nr:hypothetical protein [Anaerolineae bacterium]